jgi:endonuclease I
MAKTKINAEREHRIEMEVVVDAAYTEEERAMAWYRSGRTALVSIRGRHSQCNGFFTAAPR